MKILLIHNYYQLRGGEETIFETEKQLLEQNGHEVILYSKNNAEIGKYGFFKKLTLPLKTIYNFQSKSELKKLLRNVKPDIAHIHNTFPLLSVSVIDACWEAKVPVVQTLYNFRYFCQKGFLFRNGNICEKCVTKVVAWPGIIHKCYRNSYIGSITLAVMYLFIRLTKQYAKVNAYISLSQTAKDVLVRGGIPQSKIVVKYNSISNISRSECVKGAYALFVGRLSPEKGLPTLLNAWKELPHIPLKMAGVGPLTEEITQIINKNKMTSVTLVGQCTKNEINSLLHGAKFLIVPSEWFETFGMVIIEAFASGTPVIASKLGCMQELVVNNYSGLHFEAGNSADLAKKVAWAWENKAAMQQMGTNAINEYEAKYTHEKNYQALMQLYQKFSIRK